MASSVRLLALPHCGGPPGVGPDSAADSSERRRSTLQLPAPLGLVARQGNGCDLIRPKGYFSLSKKLAIEVRRARLLLYSCKFLAEEAVKTSADAARQDWDVRVLCASVLV
jgi:hypothetical protein